MTDGADTGITVSSRLTGAVMRKGETMDNTISRAAAIDAVQQHRESVLGGYEYDEGTAFVYAAAHNHIIDVIKHLPSAQQERKKGKWIYNSPVTMKCNQCGFVIKDWDWHRFKYCPNCIADMRGENDG